MIKKTIVYLGCVMFSLGAGSFFSGISVISAAPHPSKGSSSQESGDCHKRCLGVLNQCAFADGRGCTEHYEHCMALCQDKGK